MSCPAGWTPFFTTDQNGSLAWPWLTTMMRLLLGRVRELPRVEAERRCGGEPG